LFFSSQTTILRLRFEKNTLIAEYSNNVIVMLIATSRITLEQKTNRINLPFSWRERERENYNDQEIGPSDTDKMLDVIWSCFFGNVFCCCRCVRLCVRERLRVCEVGSLSLSLIPLLSLFVYACLSMHLSLFTVGCLFIFFLFIPLLKSIIFLRKK